MRAHRLPFWSRRAPSYDVVAGWTGVTPCWAGSLLGIPSAYSTDVLGFVDQIAGSLFLIVGAFFLTVFVGWLMDDPVTELQQGFKNGRLLEGWFLTLRFVVPVVLAIVLYQVGKDAVAAVAALF